MVCNHCKNLLEETEDHVYLRHLSVDTIGRYADRHSVDMSAETRSSVGRHVLVNRLSVNMSVNTRPTPRPICCDRQSLVYWSTVGEV